MNRQHDRDADMEGLLLRLGNGVRETLHNVMGLLELTVQEPLTASQTAHLSQCRAVADRLLRVANDVAELASPYDWPSNDEAFSVRGMVEELAQFAQPLAARRGVSFHLHVAREAPSFVIADRPLLQDMIHRLLDNSLQVTRSGYIQLSVKCGGGDEDSYSLLFEVADTGPGFPPEIFTGSDEPLGVDQSRGLGLPITQRRVESMGGTFRVIASSGEGSVVQLKVPVKHAGAERFQQVAPCAEPMRVLVVEDCDDSFQLFEVYVAGYGHRISRVRDGAQAVDLRKREDFDVIFMDVNMPVMDGYTATSAIRDWETANARTHIPVVLLSADDRSRQQSLGAAAGCSGYLTKPISQTDLLAALHYYGKPTALCH